MMLPFAIVPLVLAAPAPFLAVPAEDPHPFTIHDMLAMERISDPQASPDGSWVAYTVRTTDLAANRGRNDVWISSVDGSTSRQLTANEASDSGARWMPDGALARLPVDAQRLLAVWRIALDGGEAVQLTDFPIGVDNVLPFPDGERLLLTMEVYPTRRGARSRRNEEARRRGREEPGQGTRLREPALPALGHVGGRASAATVFVGKIAGRATRSTCCPASTATARRAPSAASRRSRSRRTARKSPSRPSR
jgi:hypothetical protein